MVECRVDADRSLGMLATILDEAATIGTPDARSWPCARR